MILTKCYYKINKQCYFFYFLDWIIYEIYLIYILQITDVELSAFQIQKFIIHFLWLLLFEATFVFIFEFEFCLEFCKLKLIINFQINIYKKKVCQARYIVLIWLVTRKIIFTTLIHLD